MYQIYWLACWGFGLATWEQGVDQPPPTNLSCSPDKTPVPTTEEQNLTLPNRAQVMEEEEVEREEDIHMKISPSPLPNGTCTDLKAMPRWDLYGLKAMPRWDLKLSSEVGKGTFAQNLEVARIIRPRSEPPELDIDNVEIVGPAKVEGPAQHPEESHNVHERTLLPRTLKPWSLTAAVAPSGWRQGR
ncbi:hypothetical protein AMTR_s00015p00094220 [Amborella trichopoda]|uniref:Serine-threonine/tyrosine-protein kinase catalytic domain-containing protein n=1 Tax=Amborella trichopoda TaxID=13333 RepID=W1PFT2_AMBTC|nr:hypothetical protein AMTR_s00015p00094220 [Amborella trichopoda]